MAMARRVTGKTGGKPGGLQDMINSVTAETSPGADPVLLARIVEYINRSPDRGSDKALKYMRNRFAQKHVKVQNLTLIVLENCTKRCGHMFREKLPFSDLWAELHKVATLKRKADVQIYNKILALIEDWSEAIDLPAYRQEMAELKTKAVRFPTRTARDLTEYREGGTVNALGQPQALPPGSGSALRAEFDGPGSPPPAGASPSGSRASTPYAAYGYGGNGHFAPPKASPGNVASLPDNHLSSGQSAPKLREDLFAAKNSADLLAEMLSSVSLADAPDVKQDHVTELAGQCEAMLPRLAALAEQVSDEANLKQTLTVHGDMEDALVKYRGLLEVAEGRAPGRSQPPSPLADEARAAEATAPPPPPAAKQKSVSLLDFDDEPAATPTAPAAPAPASYGGPTAPAAARSSVPAPAPASGPAFGSALPPQPAKRSPQDLLADLFDAPQQVAPSQPTPAADGQPSFGDGAPNFGGPPQQQGQGFAAWSGTVPRQQANPFGGPGGDSVGAKEKPAPSAGASQGFAAFGEPPAFGRAASDGSPPQSSGSAKGSAHQPSQQPNFSQAPPSFSQGFGQPNFGQQPQQQPQPQGFGQAPPSFQQSPNFWQQQPPPPQYGSGGQVFSPQGPGAQGFASFGEAPAFGGPPPHFGPPSGGPQSGFAGPPPFGGGPPQFGAPPPYAAQQPPFSGGFGGQPPFGNAAPFQTPPAPQQQNSFSQAPQQQSVYPKPAGAQPPKQSGSPNFGGGDHSSGLIGAVRSAGPPQVAPAGGSANPFDDPPPAQQSRPASTGAQSKLQPQPGSHPKGGAAPKPSWPPPDSEDPFADLAVIRR